MRTFTNPSGHTAKTHSDTAMLMVALVRLWRQRLDSETACRRMAVAVTRSQAMHGLPRGDRRPRSCAAPNESAG